MFLIVLFIIVYFLYMNIPGEAENLEVRIAERDGSVEIGEVKQFYSNMRFNHRTISYDIEDECSGEQVVRMIRAFDEIEKWVSALRFQEVEFGGDVEVICSEEKVNVGSGKKYFIAGEGGAKEIIESGESYVIVEGIIYLFDNKKSIKCDYPNVEVHEILHVLGFDHSDDKRSIMYPFLTSCSQKLDEGLIDELNRIYALPNLPDLLFEDFNAVKRGRYLDFNLTMKNFGVVDADNIVLTILDNGDVIDIREIESIGFGAGITLRTQNLRLKRRNPESIKFIIDIDDEIEELNEGNNEAIIELG